MGLITRLEEYRDCFCNIDYDEYNINNVVVSFPPGKITDYRMAQNLFKFAKMTSCIYKIIDFEDGYLFVEQYVIGDDFLICEKAFPLSRCAFNFLK